MSRYHRARVPGGTYFFTAVIERRQPILTHAYIRLALREAIVLLWEMLPFRIDGWVLLSDHLHAFWGPARGDADFLTRGQLVKRHVTRTCGPAYRRLRPSDRAACRKTMWCLLAASLLGASDPRRAGLFPSSRLSAR